MRTKIDGREIEDKTQNEIEAERTMILQVSNQPLGRRGVGDLARTR